jgi:diguanylate cyclase (GGDEF)-like protein
MIDKAQGSERPARPNRIRGESMSVAHGKAASSDRPGTGASLPQTYWAESSNLVLTVEGMLLALGILSMSFTGVDDSDRISIQAGLFFFATWVTVFYFASLRGAYGYWVISLRTWAMVPYVAWIVWFTDALVSPLRNAFLMVILASALTVGMWSTMFVILLIAANTVFLGDMTAGTDIWSLSYLGEIVTRMTPQLIVAYVAALYGHDLRYAMLRRKLLRETDDSTGLLSMSGFSIAAGRLIGEARREAAPVSLLAITIDNFDALSGQEVDKVMREVSALVFGALRRQDVVGRHSPQTILVLVAGASLEYCEGVERRIRDGVAEAMKSGSLQVTALQLSYRSSSVDAREGRAEDLLLQAEPLAERVAEPVDRPGL